MPGCRLSAKMTTEKCAALRAYRNVECIGCDGEPTRTVRLTMASRIYEAIAEDARAHEIDPEDHILSLLEIAASGEYALIRRASV